MSAQTVTKVSAETIVDYINEIILSESSVREWAESGKYKVLSMINELVKSIKPKKERKKKDKNAPKGAKSAYNVFCQLKRAEVKKANPEAKPKDIMTLLGAAWKKISDDEKAISQYKELAEEDKVRYAEEKEHYVPSEQPEKIKKKKDPNAPKHARSAYNLFSNDIRKELEKETGKKGKELMSILGARWKEFSSTNPDNKYVKLAADDKLRYASEMEGYTPPEGEPEKKQRKKKDPNSPKNPKTSYMFFSADERKKIKKENKDLKGPQISALLSERWKALNESTKNSDLKSIAKYKEMVEKDKVRYTNEMKTYVPKTEETEEEEESDAAVNEEEPDVDGEEEQLEEEESVPEDEKAVREIISSHSGPSITKKYIKEELKKRGLVLDKDRLNELVKKVST